MTASPMDAHPSDEDYWLAYGAAFPDPYANPPDVVTPGGGGEAS